MDTKSRNIRYAVWIKALAVILCIAGLLAAAWGIRQVNYFYLAFSTPDYNRTQDVYDKLWNTYQDLQVYPLTYTSEEVVSSGNWITDDRLHESGMSGESDYTRLINDAENRYSDMIINAQNSNNSEEVASLLAGKQAYMDEIKKQYDEARDSERANLIRQELLRFKNYQNQLQEMKGVFYYAKSADGTVVSNIGGSKPEDLFPKLPAYRLFQNNEGYDPYGNPSYQSIYMENTVAWVGFSQEAYDNGLQTFLTNRRQGTAGLGWFAGGLLAFLLGMAWLLYAAGRKPCAEGVKLLPGDRIYLDVGLAAAVIVFAFCAVGLNWLYTTVTYSASMDPYAVYVLAALLVVCIAVTVMIYLTSLVRRAKRHEALKHTLVYTLCSWLYRTVNRALDAGPVARKAGLLFSGYAALSSLFLFAIIEFSRGYAGPGPVLFFLILFFAVNILALVYLVHKMSAVKTILAGIGKIRSGDLTYRIPAGGGAPFAEMADGINNIAEGLDAAVASEVKAERMKAELITNVSHDLRTPLTSIITYVDLLKTEGLASENASGYVEVLERKARRLKVLTDDLFEAAKAASGSIKPNITRLNVGELIEQGLGELSDRIRESGLDFRCSLPEPGLFIEADGKLLWRVMENLLSNVFKYAMPNSRVYISAAAAGSRAVVTVKNISAAELNVPASELMERFTRGDAARASEGSGLGLAIAKSLVELQGGRFFVEIDGDLFKAGMDFQEAI